MNYKSINEVFSASISNMEVLRNNSKLDDGETAVTGVDWFTYNNVTASTIYVHSNSYIGFGVLSEQLKVNRRDGALYSLYREEGTLFNKYRFLRIRFNGYSHYSQTSGSYALTYDVIIWDTGDISLHMLSIPTSYNTGTYTLTETSTYSYSVSENSPHVTFVRTDSGFEVQNNIIQLTFEKRYLIRSDSTCYTITNNTLSILEVDELNSSTFLNYGMQNFPDLSVCSTLSSFEILYWQEIISEPEIGFVVTGCPPIPQTLYTENYDISKYNGIERIEALSSDDVLFAISFDNGQIWKYYKDNIWVDASTENEGMTKNILQNITAEEWLEITSSTSFMFRCTMTDVNSSLGTNLYIKCN